MGEPETSQLQVNEAHSVLRKDESVALHDELRESRLVLLKRLQDVSSEKEKRVLIEQWREQHRDLAEQERKERMVIGVHQPAFDVELSPVEEELKGLPANQIEEVKLNLEMRNERIELMSDLSGNCAVDRRAAIDSFREKQVERLTRLEALRLSRHDNQRSQAASRVLPTSTAETSEQSGPAQALEERLAAIHRLEASLVNATPTERRQEIGRYRAQVGIQRTDQYSSGDGKARNN